MKSFPDDVIGMTYGSLFDSQTSVLPVGDGNTEVQVVSWYDNGEFLHINMCRTIKYFGKLLQK